MFALVVYIWISVKHYVTVYKHFISYKHGDSHITPIVYPRKAMNVSYLTESGFTSKINHFLKTKKQLLVTGKLVCRSHQLRTVGILAWGRKIVLENSSLRYVISYNNI